MRGIGDADPVGTRIFDEIINQGVFFLFRDTFDNGHIGFDHLVGTDCFGQAGSGFGRFGEDHRPSDRPIEPVHEAAEHIAWFVVGFFQIFFAKIQNAGVAAAIRLYRYIDRLLNAKQMIVFV